MSYDPRPCGTWDANGAFISDETRALREHGLDEHLFTRPTPEFAAAYLRRLAQDAMLSRTATTTATPSRESASTSTEPRE